MAEKINPVPSYSYLIGIGKTIKNVGIVFGVPALVFLVNNYTEWVPIEYVAHPITLTLFGALGYFIKNLIKNHPSFN